MHAPPWKVAVLVFVAAFCLYGLTLSQELQGYEPETTAVAEGFARTGDFIILSESPLRDVANAEGFPGKDGKLIGRAGLPKSLIKIAFYLAGWGLDELGSGGEQYTWRKRVLWFALPAVTALAVAFFFLVVWRLRRSIAWAVSLAAIVAAGSVAWPYSKTGQETVLMMSLTLTLAAVLYAQESRSWRPWAAAGFGAGLVLADKPYGIVALAAILALLIKPLREADKETRGRYLLAFALPCLAWAAMFCFYNWTRTGGALDTGRSEPGFTLAAPFNFLGFFISPGKGLIFYSPLVVLGILGLWPLWREQPRMAKSIVGAVVGGTLVVATLPFWSDESWGPRYIVWIAWLLLLPIPWWATSSGETPGAGRASLRWRLRSSSSPWSRLLKRWSSLPGTSRVNRSSIGPARSRW